MKKIKIKSCHITPFGRLDLDFLGITLDAVRAVLVRTDARCVRDVYVASYAASALCGIEQPFRAVTQAIQAEFPALRATYHGMFKTGGEALFTALDALRERTSRGGPVEALVVGSEKMTHQSPARAAGILSRRESAHDRSYGATLPALGALATRAYLERHRIPENAMHRVAVKNHENGARNPKAHFRRPVTEDDVAASPLVCDPLRRLHCAPISDGAAALLLSDSEGGSCFRGWGRGLDTPLFQDRRDIARFVATAGAARTAFAGAGISPADADIVEIHDAFCSFELMNLEEMGFYSAGQAWRALEAGELAIGGRVAVNPSGGMKAKGHPIGATGLSSAVEIRDQLNGTAGERQHGGARLGVAQSVGGVSRESYVFVIDAC